MSKDRKRGEIIGLLIASHDAATKACRLARLYRLPDALTDRLDWVSSETGSLSDLSRSVIKAQEGGEP